jgi:threonine dehydratase
VAYSCRRLSIKGRIFLPRTTPRQKRDRIASLGGAFVETVVVGDTYDDAGREAVAEVERTGAVLVPPFDDERTIAGQGTVVAEALAQAGAAPDVVVVPVGGGGLIAGTAVWMNDVSPTSRVFGVEPAGAPSMTAALTAGAPVVLETLDTFVDGAAVRRVGDVTFSLVRDLVDDVVTVDEGAVCTEMLDLYQSDGIIAEPAGAMATAALGCLPIERGATVLCLLSGGNNDVSRYGDVLERSLVHRGLKHYFLVEFPQEPGALRRFLDEVLGPRDDITLFEYVKKSNREIGPALVGIELASQEDIAALLARMAESHVHMERVPPGSPLFTFLL